MQWMLGSLCMSAVVALAAVPQAQERAAGATDTVTLTGCLDRAPNGIYQLKNARLAPLGQGNTVGTTGTTTNGRGTTNPTSAAQAPVTHEPETWVLKSTSDLAPHVGHQVQVTGRPGESRRTGDDTATTAAPTTTATTARVKTPGEQELTLEVQAVKMLARACS